jgi:PAS domain S-box-containing protein
LNNTEEDRSLRKRAEQLYDGDGVDFEGRSREEIQELFHELQIHQIELELQNDELRRTQRELERSRDRYADLYDFAPVGHLTLDHRGTIQEANLTAADLLDVPRSRLLGERLSRFVARDSQDAFHLYLRGLVKGDGQHAGELRMQSGSNGSWYARVTGRAARDVEDRYRLTLSDVTAKKEAWHERQELLTELEQHKENLERLVAERTQTLRISEARFRAIFEDAAIGIAVLDLEGRIVQSNDALQQLLGYDGEALRGRRVLDVTHEDDVQAARELFAAMVEGERDDYHREKRYLRKDGEAIWVQVVTSMVLGDDGEPRFAIKMVEDVTEKREAQDALIRAEKMSVTGRLAASLAHEINNPLQTVVGCLGLAMEDLRRDERTNRYLVMAAREIDRAARIVGELRDLNRRSTAQDQEEVVVARLLKRVLDLADQQAENGHVQVRRELDDGKDLVVQGVADRLHQVFLNLTLNAIDAMPDGGELTVSLRPTTEPQGAEVRFHDEGVGISPEVQEELFQPFYTTKDDGVGLGLYISRNIVEGHGGSITVQSEPGGGTTFTVWLPHGGVAR